MKYSSNLILNFVAILLVSTLLISGCDSDNTSEDASAPDNTGDEVVPTMPAAQFTSVGAQSGLTTTTELTASTAVDEASPDLALGERVFSNRCAECHGDQAEGGSANALAGLEMSKADLEDLLRTGGELGSDHLFGTRAVSENGLNAIYAWLQSR